MAKKSLVESWGRRDPGARRAKVIEEATRLFAAQGYEATSVNEVAAGAGVSVGALYKYFPDKAALLEGVLSHFEAEFVAVLVTQECVVVGSRLIAAAGLIERCQTC